MNDECREWAGSRNQNGYGRLVVAGRRLVAHRLIWELVNGPIPDGMFVLHLCDNPPCCNPSHLHLGTHLDNMRDCFTKGRNSNGQERKTHCAKGHAYDETNTYHRRDGARACKECRRNEVRRRRARAKAAT